MNNTIGYQDVMVGGSNEYLAILNDAFSVYQLAEPYIFACAFERMSEHGVPVYRKAEAVKPYVVKGWLDSYSLHYINTTSSVALTADIARNFNRHIFSGSLSADITIKPDDLEVKYKSNQFDVDDTNGMLKLALCNFGTPIERHLQLGKVIVRQDDGKVWLRLVGKSATYKTNEIEGLIP